MCGRSNSEPGGCQCDEQVGEFTEREQRTAEYEAERSADVACQRQSRVSRFSLDVRVLQLREEHLLQPPVDNDITPHHTKPHRIYTKSTAFICAITSANLVCFSNSFTCAFTEKLRTMM